MLQILLYSTGPGSFHEVPSPPLLADAISFPDLSISMHFVDVVPTSKAAE